MGIIAKAAIGLFVFAAAGTALTGPPPSTASAPAAAPAAARDPAICAPFGNVAAAAWELKHRGIREDVAIRAATAQVTAPRLLPLVGDAVRIGYQTRTQEGARHRAETFCNSGTLGLR